MNLKTNILMLILCVILAGCSSNRVPMIDGTINVSSSSQTTSSTSDEIINNSSSDKSDEASSSEESSNSKNENNSLSSSSNESKNENSESSKIEESSSVVTNSSTATSSDEKSSSSETPSSSEESSSEESSISQIISGKPTLPKPSSSNVNNDNSVSTEPSKSQSQESKPQNNISETDEKRAMWISYLDFYTLLKEKSESQFRTNIKKAFNNITEMGLNTVIVQVRPFSDALYYSDIFPMSHIVTGTENVDAGFDPLEIMVYYAHNYGLKIEAWINPYRIRNTGTKAEISTGNPAYKYLNNSAVVVNHSNGVSYNPASKIARDIIISGVEEIVSNYDIDAIHFDDYFYPTTAESFDKNSYAQYKNNGGNLSLENWRRENVNILVRDTYSAIKAINKNVEFGISPQANCENNYDNQYIDVDKWLSNSGYVDYICPQIYFGFDNSTYPFSYTVNLWNNKIKVSGISLYVGLAPYKIGTEDTWAGNGKYEWQNSTDMMERMVLQSRKQSKYGGFFLYRYDSVFNPNSNVRNDVLTEMKNLKSILD